MNGAEDLVRLRARVHHAACELHDVRCNDPAAASAIHVVRLTEQTLRCWWMPTLDRALERVRSRSAPHPPP